MADPKSPVVYLAVFLIAMQLFSQVLISTGVASMLGLGVQTGANEAVDNAVDEADGKQETGAATGSTLFGLYNVLGGSLGKLFAVLNPGITMLGNVGVPYYITGFLNPIVTFIKGLGVIWFLRGI